MLKLKMLVQKSAFPTQYGSISAPKNVGCIPGLILMQVSSSILPFRHQNDSFTVSMDYPILSTCIFITFFVIEKVGWIVDST